MKPADPLAQAALPDSRGINLFQADPDYAVRQRLDVMVSNNPVPMLLTTPGFSIVEANAAYIEMSGIRERDLVKTNLKNFKIISQKGEGAKVALQEKRRSFGEVIVELASGRHILEQYCIPIMGKDQTITSLLFVYNEITAQKKRNTEIEQLRQRSETIVQQNPIPMLMTNPDFIIIEANAAYGKMSGISRDKIIGMSIRDIKILEQKGEGFARRTSIRCGRTRTRPPFRTASSTAPCRPAAAARNSAVRSPTTGCPHSSASRRNWC